MKAEQNEAAAAKAEEEIELIEARKKLLNEEEDVCPPAWSSASGWIDLRVAKHFTFKLTFPKGEEKLDGEEKLEHVVKARELTCKRRERHWKFGTFRVVHLMKLNDERLVAKAFIHPRGKEKDWVDVQSTARQYLLAKEMTSRFVKRVKEKQPTVDLKMKYVSTDVLELSTGEYLSTERCSGREFKEAEGDFIKWNNNDDYVQEEGGKIDPYPQALSHFSFVESKNAYLLTDVQGWQLDRCHYILTDPALHTNDRQRVPAIPGGSDLGYKGMQRFFQVHCCNEICKLLGLHKEHIPKPPKV